MKYNQTCSVYKNNHNFGPSRHNWQFEKNEMVHVGLVYRLKSKFVCACGQIQHRTLKVES